MNMPHSFNVIMLICFTFEPHKLQHNKNKTKIAEQNAQHFTYTIVKSLCGSNLFSWGTPTIC